MASDGEATRRILLRTAERLFASKGVEAVSLREISEEAGQRNHSAAGYHFGSKESLLDAILERHSAPIHRRYDAELDAADARGDVTARELAAILVRPIVEKLDDPDGGLDYLALAAQLTVSPTFPLEQRPVAATPPVLRLGAALHARTAVPDELMPLKFARVPAVMFAAVLQYDRLARAGVVSLSRDAFVDELSDSVLAIITAGADRARNG